MHSPYLEKYREKAKDALNMAFVLVTRILFQTFESIFEISSSLLNCDVTIILGVVHRKFVTFEDILTRLLYFFMKSFLLANLFS